MFWLLASMMMGFSLAMEMALRFVGWTGSTIIGFSGATGGLTGVTSWTR